MSFEYRLDARPSAAEYIALLADAGLAHRRPVDKPDVIQAAIDGAQVMVTAWDGYCLVGALRAITDFHLHCYVGEIAVASTAQRAGVGLAMQRLLRDQLGPECKIKLSSTEDAATYYPRIGYTPIKRAWELLPGTDLG
ncbi:GNAT family N-acetyltransferase [Demequina sp.]|uniref:GNAT family N-acetyltransferase n=1 Tax=Demequina sp. TaxID=2050685 RepID=UPI003D0D0893